MSNSGGYEGMTPAEVAEDKGLVYVEPADDELFIDADDKALVAARMAVLLPVLARLGFAPSVTKVTTSKSGNFHYYLRCQALGAETDPRLRKVLRIALQAILGSDPMHEALSLATALDREKDSVPPTVFFELS